MGKEIRINVRANEDLKDRLKSACQLTGANETTLVIACVQALVDYIEENGEIRLPLKVVPKSEAKKTLQGVLPVPSGSMRSIAPSPGDVILNEKQARAVTPEKSKQQPLTKTRRVLREMGQQGKSK